MPGWNMRLPLRIVGTDELLKHTAIWKHTGKVNDKTLGV